MRLIVQGAGLTVLALIALCLSGGYFLYEEALHARGVIVTARIEAMDVQRGMRRSWRPAPVKALHQKMSFSYTMPDGRSYRVSYPVTLDYYLLHHVGEQVPLRVDAVHPRQFEVGAKDYAGLGLFAGSAGMILALAAALNFWLAYHGLPERAQVAQPLSRPKARLRRIYMRRP